MGIGEKYIETRMALNKAMEEFIRESGPVYGDNRRAASTLLDVIYDIDPTMHEAIGRESFPELSGDDWIATEKFWEQRKMWKVMNG